MLLKLIATAQRPHFIKCLKWEEWEPLTKRHWISNPKFIIGGIADNHNENYSRLLFKRPELSLDDVITLDKVQKKIPVSEMEIQHLRDLKLVINTGSNLFITDSHPNATFNDYKKLILNFLRINGTATGEDINNLIIPLLIEDESSDRKQKKVSNIISKLAYTDKRIENISKSVRYPVWKLSNNIDSNNKDKK
jgi:hypothetical protein